MNTSVNTTKRKTFAKVATTMAAAAALVVGGSTAAQADPAGQYYYVCVQPDGSSLTLPAGTSLQTCRGSYLKKYLDGKLISSANLAAPGQVADPNAITIDCAIGLAGTAIAVYTTAGAVAYVGLALGGLGTYRACTA